MRKQIDFLTHCRVACLCLFAALFIPLSAFSASPPNILSAVANSSANQLVITGTNLAPTTGSPVVKLDGTQLTLPTASSIEIVANLPSSFGPGTYDLTVTAGALTGNFDVTIGAAGPRGPAGKTGPQGPAGTIVLPFSGSGSNPYSKVFEINAASGAAIAGFSADADGVDGYGGTGIAGVSYSGAGGTFSGGGVSDDGLGGGDGVIVVPGSQGGVGILAWSGQYIGSQSIVSNTVAGTFLGDVQVSGNLSKSGGSFKIDHLLDPANKYLYHSFVESPDMMNIYNGNATTDGAGIAIIALPDWFEALNRDFRYQLTAVGQFTQAMVLSKIMNNSFTIKTDKPNVEVSWQVTGIRQDAWANAHRIPTEVDKAADEQGRYLHPELFGHAGEPGIAEIHHPRPKPRVASAR